MRRYLLSPLAIFLLANCGTTECPEGFVESADGLCLEQSGDDVPDVPGSDVTDTDTPDADTDTTDTEAVDADAFPEATYPCLAMHGIHESDSSWGYRWKPTDRVGGRIMEVYEYDAENHTATLWTYENWENPGAFTFTAEYYDYVVCNDDGLHLKRRLETTTQVILLGSSTEVLETDVETVYDTPMLLRPNSMEVGDSWESHAVGTIYDASRPEQAINETKTTTVIAGDVLVPSGVPGLQWNTYELDDGYSWSPGFGNVSNGIWTLETHSSIPN